MKNFLARNLMLRPKLTIFLTLLSYPFGSMLIVLCLKLSYLPFWDGETIAVILCIVLFLWLVFSMTIIFYWAKKHI